MRDGARLWRILERHIRVGTPFLILQHCGGMKRKMRTQDQRRGATAAAVGADNVISTYVHEPPAFRLAYYCILKETKIDPVHTPLLGAFAGIPAAS